jgi:hypothetical protein
VGEGTEAKGITVSCYWLAGLGHWAQVEEVLDGVKVDAQCVAGGGVTKWSLQSAA